MRNPRARQYSEKMDLEGELARAQAQITISGNHNDARRVRELEKLHGSKALPFLERAAREGSDAVRAAAIQALGKIDAHAVAELALTILPMTTQDCDVRAAAAEALSRVHTDVVLEALLQATVDEPMTAGAAIRALPWHRSPSATVRIHGFLRALVAQLAATKDDDALLVGRRYRAFNGGGDGGLLRLMVHRSYPDIEADLISWWRTHPSYAVRMGAARMLASGSIENAYLLLTDGVRNDQGNHPSGWDDDLAHPMSLLFSGAIYTVLSKASPAEAFDRLSPFFDPRSRTDWFGTARAQVILQLLIGQLGENTTSWLYFYSAQLHDRGLRPDSRWQELDSRSSEGMLQTMLDQLCEMLRSARAVARD